MKKKMRHSSCFAFLQILILCGCDREYLEQRPDRKLLVPTTLEDFRMLLDNSNEVMNLSPALPEIASDNFHAVPAALMNLPEERNAYTWQPRVFENNQLDWDKPYQQVLYANIVLEGLDGLRDGGRMADDIRGTALFTRAMAHFHVMQQFAPPYRQASAAADPGIPLRLRADINAVTQRSSAAESYIRIIEDLEVASELLQNTVPYKTRPSKQAAYALLARVYLQMGDYASALRHSEACLSIDAGLLDYNSFNAAIRYPMPRSLDNGNIEVIYHSTFLNTLPLLHASGALLSNVAGVDPSLFGLYADSDLRKTLFFSQGNGMVYFRGSYTGTYLFFSGIARDEVYLIKAECQVRLGHWEEGTTTLNQLLRNRYTDHIVEGGLPADGGEALQLVLTERRKELAFRGVRWGDLRRLNREPATSISLTREFGGERLRLEPDGSAYTFPIPDNVIARSGIPQNGK